MAFELTNKNCVFFNQHDSVNNIRSMREGERSFFFSTRRSDRLLHDDGGNTSDYELFESIKRFRH